MAFAWLVIIQLGTSLIMISPRETRLGDLLFEIHEYAGMLAFLWIFLF